MIVMPKVKSAGDFDSLEVADGRGKIHQRDPMKPRDNFYIDWVESEDSTEIKDIFSNQSECFSSSSYIGYKVY